jgi:Carboxylesterase family
MFWIFSLLSCVPLFGVTVLAQSVFGITHTGTLQLVPFPNAQDGNTLPLLTLPYATYQAHSYDPDKDVYIFRNIRYAAPPVGNLRWAPPQDPYIESRVQDGSKGGSCFQSTPHQVENSVKSFMAKCV